VPSGQLCAGLDQLRRLGAAAFARACRVWHARVRGSNPLSFGPAGTMVKGTAGAHGPGPQRSPTDTSGAAAPRSAARSRDPIEPVIHGMQAFVGTRSVYTEPADRGVQRTPAVDTGHKAPQVSPSTQPRAGSTLGGGPEFESPTRLAASPPGSCQRGGGHRGRAPTPAPLLLDAYGRDDFVVQPSSGVGDDPVRVLAYLEGQHRSFYPVPAKRVGPGRPSPQVRLRQLADGLGAEPPREVLPVACVLLGRLQIREPEELEIDLSAPPSGQVNAVGVFVFSSVISTGCPCGVTAG
jgi:hypothetical protein